MSQKPHVHAMSDYLIKRERSSRKRSTHADAGKNCNDCTLRVRLSQATIGVHETTRFPPHRVLQCTIASATRPHMYAHSASINAHPACGAAHVHFCLPISTLSVCTKTPGAHLPACYNAQSHRPLSTCIHISQITVHGTRCGTRPFSLPIRVGGCAPRGASACWWLPNGRGRPLRLPCA